MRSFLSYGRDDRKSNFKIPTGKITPFTNSHDVTSLFRGQYAVPRAPNRETAHCAIGTCQGIRLGGSAEDASGSYVAACAVPGSFHEQRKVTLAKVQKKAT